jgi:hypothetical protein
MIRHRNYVNNLAREKIPTPLKKRTGVTLLAEKSGFLTG